MILENLLYFLHIPQCVKWVAEKTANVSITDLLSEIEGMPMLFIHGQKDILVPIDTDFEDIWQATRGTEKRAFLTPFLHVKNMDNKWVYERICQFFIKAKNSAAFTNQFPLRFHLRYDD